MKVYWQNRKSTITVILVKFLYYHAASTRQVLCIYTFTSIRSQTSSRHKTWCHHMCLQSHMWPQWPMGLKTRDAPIPVSGTVRYQAKVLIKLPWIPRHRYHFKAAHGLQNWTVEIFQANEKLVN